MGKVVLLGTLPWGPPCRGTPAVPQAWVKSMQKKSASGLASTSAQDVLMGVMIWAPGTCRVSTLVSAWPLSVPRGRGDV